MWAFEFPPGYNPILESLVVIASGLSPGCHDLANGTSSSLRGAFPWQTLGLCPSTQANPVSLTNRFRVRFWVCESAGCAPMQYAMIFLYRSSMAVSIRSSSLKDSILHSSMRLQSMAPVPCTFILAGLTSPMPRRASPDAFSMPCEYNS